MSDHLRDRVIAAVGEHYLIESELGRGGMAAVYGAVDLRLNRKVAIKVLPPEHAFNGAVRSRFVREAQMAAGLTHPNIVPIYSVDEKDGLVYFVMALVDGEPLALRLHQSGRVAPEDVRAIVSAVADALHYAHAQGVVHRDIKPDNILIDRTTNRPMVTDFGIARAAAEEHRLTVTGMAVGTPAYMSPVLCTPSRPCSPTRSGFAYGLPESGFRGQDTGVGCRRGKERQLPWPNPSRVCAACTPAALEAMSMEGRRMPLNRVPAMSTNSLRVWNHSCMARVLKSRSQSLRGCLSIRFSNACLGLGAVGLG